MPAAIVGQALTAATMMVAKFPAVVPKKIRIQNKAILAAALVLVVWSEGRICCRLPCWNVV